MHKFKKDLNYGFLLQRFRNGKVTLDDIRLINTRVINPRDTLPHDIRYATYFNRDRVAINTCALVENIKRLNSNNNHAISREQCIACLQ